MTEEFTLVIGGPTTFDYGSVEIKGDKKYYIAGYASTGDIDLENDMVTEEGLQDMLEQMKGKIVKIDLEHEAWTSEEGPNILPVGKIVEAKYDRQGKRLWVKAILNEDSNKFKKIWNSVKNKFIDAFSIAFRPVESMTQVVDGQQVRLLKKLNILNVALTGNPANPHARITDVFVKSLNHLEEVNNMTEQEKAEKPVEEQVEKPQEEAVVEEQPAEEVGYEAELKSLREEFAKEAEDYKASLKSLQEELKSANEELASVKSLLEKPQMKSILEEKPEEPKEEVEVKEQNPLDLIR